MKRVSFLCVLLLAAALPAAAAGTKSTAAVSWSMNASVMDACSCPVFCQCFFTTSPAGHESHSMAGMGHEGHTEHYCRFNNAYRVNKGAYGATKLDGAKFWLYGDLGSDFSKGEMDWAVVTYDGATTKEQREALGEIIAHLFPVKWKSLTTAEGDIEFNLGKDGASAKLDGGKTAEVQLKRFEGMNKAPVIIRNLPYFGAASNDGFIVMPNVVEALHTGDRAFEFHGTNGFVTTINIESKTGAAAAPAGY